MGKHGGTVFIALGLLLLVGAAGLTVYNLDQDKNAGQEAVAVVENLNELLADTEIRVRPAAELGWTANTEQALLSLDGHDYMGLITLPTLELQLPVQDKWSYKNLKISPCRMQGSPETEDLVIIAHNYQTHFGTLDQLLIGDEVSVTLIDGTTYVYRVDAMEIVQPTAVEDVTSGEWPLTLFTCTLGGRTRVVVRCDWAEE